MLNVIRCRAAKVLSNMRNTGQEICATKKVCHKLYRMVWENTISAWSKPWLRR